MTFQLLDPTRRGAGQRELLAQRKIPQGLGSLRESAQYFQPSPELVAAVNVALCVGAPLLLTGEPGTGKTQVAHYLARYFELSEEGPDQRFFELDVRSNTSGSDLLYEFDSVAYFHAAHDPSRAGKPLERGQFVRPGPLWKAMKTSGPTLVLLDEIDKAPRDFPNDLLGVLAQSRFHVPEMPEGEQWICRAEGEPPPIIVITSNSERRLPEPFLRRCIFHHIDFDNKLLRRAVAARREDFPTLEPATIEAAIDKLLELRSRNLRKKPATAELLVWLTVLAAQGGTTARDLTQAQLADLPALSALVKDRDDLAAL